MGGIVWEPHTMRGGIEDDIMDWWMLKTVLQVKDIVLL